MKRGNEMDKKYYALIKNKDGNSEYIKSFSNMFITVADIAEADKYTIEQIDNMGMIDNERVYPVDIETLLIKESDDKRMFYAAIKQPGSIDRYLYYFINSYLPTYDKKKATQFTLKEVMRFNKFRDLKIEPKQIRDYEFTEPTKVDKMFKEEGFSKDETVYKIIYSSRGCYVTYVFKKNKKKVYIYNRPIDFETDFMEGIECVKAKVEELGWKPW